MARPLILAIHGVGIHDSSEIESDLRAVIGAVREDDLEYRVFEWNDVAIYAPSAPTGISRYANWFSQTFVSAAWQPSSERSSRPAEAVDALAQLAFSLCAMALAFAAVLALATDLVSRLVRFITYPSITSQSFRSLSGYLDAVRGTLLPGLINAAMITTTALVAAWLLFLTAGLVIRLCEGAYTRSTAPLWLWLRRHSFVLLLAPALMLSRLLFQPPPKESDKDAGNRALASALQIPVYVLGAIIGSLVSIFTGTWGYFYRAFLLSLGLLVALRLLSALWQGAFAIAARGWLTGAKVLLDVAFYVGAPEHRAAIQNHLATLIEDARGRGCTEFFVVAHSLGSVIAADSLASSAAWRNTDTVYLITLGSPLRRLFVRFFPGLYFPRRPPELGALAAQRVDRFYWMNVFRPHDYVGGWIGTGGTGSNVIVWRIFPIHTGYWSDLRAAEGAIGRLPALQPFPRAAPGSVSAFTFAETARLPPWAAKAGSRLAVLASAAAATAGAIALLIAMGSNSLARLRWPVHDRSESSIARATVSHKRYFTGTGKNASREHVFSFHWTDRRGRVHDLSSSVTGTFGLFSDPRFDYERLSKYLRDGCDTGRWFQFGWSGVCERDDIAIVFDETNPARFHLPDFEFRPTFVRRSARFVVWVVFPLFGWALATAAIIGLAGWCRELQRFLLGLPEQ